VDRASYREESPYQHESPTLRLGISACLHGEEVRYNGADQRDDLLLGTIGRYVRWVTVCPEVELGLGVPRETLRLEGDPASPRLVQTQTRRDITDGMREWARFRLATFYQNDVDGFIAKKNSPSCGVFRVKLYDANGSPSGASRGIFADELTKAFPLLPVEEEGRLRDPVIRENFVERIFAYHRLKALFKPEATPAALVAFHTAHKLTLMAHHPDGQRELGRIVAEAGKTPFGDVVAEYAKLFMGTLSIWATRGKHTNALTHAFGFVKDRLDARDKTELLGIIEDYRRGIVPLVVPLTLLKHHLGRHEAPEWIHQQVYLNPYPKELLLRNHV
jgi:uncharacterized protein YbgA (DUF1722 family)/uncharacterized protein YbbK (DUF523 family)